MSYIRVIPRDLFNEADLLKCYGRLWILLNQTAGHRASLDYADFDGQPFEIDQDESSGAIRVRNLELTIGDGAVDREVIRLHRPLNSRQKWPLWATPPGDDADDIAVFDEAGDLTAEMRALITAPPEEKA